MASLNEIAYSIADKIGKPIDYLFINDIKHSIITYRALFIRQDYTKNGFYNPLVIQDLGCVETEKVDSAECCEYESGCDVVRTKLELPDPIRLKGLEDFIFVGGIDKRTRFSMIIPEELNYLCQSKYTKRFSRYYYLNKRIYLYEVPPGVINVRGIFADPRQASKFKRCGDDTPCYSDDDSFPCPEDMIVGIRNGILGGELRILRDTNDGEETKTNTP